MTNIEKIRDYLLYNKVSEKIHNCSYTVTNVTPISCDFDEEIKVFLVAAKNLDKKLQEKIESLYQELCEL